MITTSRTVCDKSDAEIFEQLKIGFQSCDVDFEREALKKVILLFALWGVPSIHGSELTC